MKSGPGGSPLRLGVLASGAGTNLQALIDASTSGALAAEVSIVISNRPDVGALERAARHGIPSAVVPREAAPSRAERHRRIEAALDAARVGLVVLAGFDEILSEALVGHFAGRIINTHPSLLPAFGGSMHAVEQALRHGVKVSGCTVHFVTAAVDEGPILVQRCVPVLDGDTVETLHARIRAEEHRALPEAVALIAAGCVRLDGRRAVIVSPGSLADGAGGHTRVQ